MEKFKSILGLKKESFDAFIDQEIFLQEAKLIPVKKAGIETALTSVFLSALKLIKEFRKDFFLDSGIKNASSIFIYTEVSFKEDPDSRIDGLILIVQSGLIKDAAFFEVKNGGTELDKQQIERYLDIAKKYNVPKLITISNQFVSNPGQTPLVDLKRTKHVDLYHFSWSYLLTLAHILLFKNDHNIEDEDQRALMREVVLYFENDKSGICGFSQMKPGWKKMAEHLITNTHVKKSDVIPREAVESWIQEEKDMALILSRKLGVLVKSGNQKYKDNIKNRIDAEIENLLDKKILYSVLKVKDAVSDIYITAFFEKRSIEMAVVLAAPQDKTSRGKLSWLRKQLDEAKKKNPEKFAGISQCIKIGIILKGRSSDYRINFENLDEHYQKFEKGKEISRFRINLIYDFNTKFANPRYFVQKIEVMLLEYYGLIAQYLSKWEPPVPKIKEPQKEVSLPDLGASLEEAPPQERREDRVL